MNLLRNPRKEKERRFVDVAPVKKNRALFLKERVFRFELNFSRLWVWIQKNKMLAGFSAFGSIILLVGFFSLLIRAQVVVLTPASCLGGWTNPAYAEGLPDATAGDTASYTQENSAVLYNKISEIFCGDFSGDAPESAVPKRVTLSFSLAMKSKSEFFAEPTITNTHGTSTEEIINATSTLPEKGIEETPKEIKKEEILPPPLQNSSSSEEQSPSALFFNFFSHVFAQEENIPLPESQIEKAPEKLYENASATPSSSVPMNEESASGTAFISETSTSSEEKEKGAYDFEYDSVVEVVWSVDGGEWQSLGYLNPRNYENAKFELPIESWESLRGVQIALRSVAVTDALPAVFLDSVLLEVEFEKNNEPVLNEEQEFTRIFEGLRIEQMPAGFTKENITFLQGVPHTGVLMKFLHEGREELWLVGKELVNVDGGRSIEKDFPVGVKNNFIFWLSQNKETVFAYDIDKKVHYEVALPPPTDEEIGRSVVHFTKIPWTIIVASHDFYFSSEKTGEVFSDSTSFPLKIFNAKLNLESDLSQEKLETLGVPVDEKEKNEAVPE